MLEVKKLITYRSLGFAALALWILSLFVPSYSAGREVNIGFLLLAMGWMGLLYSYPFWLVNPLFAFVLIKTLRGRLCTISTWMLLFLACTSLLYGKVPSGDISNGAHFDEVYAVGWGWILWIMSTAILFSAQGVLSYQQTSETSATGSKISKMIVVSLGLTVAFTLFFVTFITGWIDRSGATQAELKRLENLAYKRGTVCKTHPPQAISPSSKLIGVVEFVSEKGFRNTEHPFTYPAKMLEMGIQKFRLNSRDYHLEQIGDELMMVSLPMASEAVARLRAYDEGFDDAAQRHIRLEDTKTQKTLYLLNAKMTSKDGNFCPDFPPETTGDTQTYKFLADSIQMVPRRTIGFNGATNVGKTFWDVSKKSTGSVQRINTADAEIPEEKMLRELVKDQLLKEYPEHQRNRNCPVGVGWSLDKEFFPLRSFLLGQKALYSATGTNNGRALCDNDHAYLYSYSLSSDKQLYFSIEKRRLTDFAAVSRDNLMLRSSAPWQLEDEYHLFSVVGEDSIKSLRFGRTSDRAVFETLVEPRVITKQ